MLTLNNGSVFCVCVEIQIQVGVMLQEEKVGVEALKGEELVI